MDKSDILHAIDLAKRVGELNGEINILKAELEDTKDRNETLHVRLTDLQLENQKHRQKIRELSAQLRLKP